MAIIYGDNNANTKYGTAYADTVYGRSGGDALYGRAGDDKIYGESGDDSLFGEDGADSLYGGDGADKISGGNGVDAIFGDVGDDVLNGNAGDDYIVGGSGKNTLYGDDGADRLRGGDFADALWGGNQNDSLWGNGGDDYLVGGAGNDEILGHAGFDKLRGDTGDDVLNGGSGDNSLWGGDGNDLLIYTGNPSIEMPKGGSEFIGGAGNDTLRLDISGIGSDGEQSFPWVCLSPGGFELLTDPDEGYGLGVGSISGVETLRFNSNDLRLDFHASTDITAYGGSLDDRLCGSQGDQHFYGGGGADEFRFQWRDTWGDGVANGHDVIHDFNKAEGDIVLFSINPMEDDDETPYHIVQEAKGSDTLFTVTRDDTGQVIDQVTVLGVTDVPYGEGFYTG